VIIYSSSHLIIFMVFHWRQWPMSWGIRTLESGVRMLLSVLRLHVTAWPLW